jgi:hypothetical protein
MIDIEAKVTMVPTTTTTAPKRRGRKPTNVGVKTYCVTIDDTTRAILEALRNKLGIGYKDIVKMILEDLASGELTTSELREFYVNTWLRTPQTGDNRSMLNNYHWTERQDAGLDRVSERVLMPLKPSASQKRKLAGRNKSEAFRLVVTYYAIKHKFVDIEYVKYPSFKIRAQ